MRFKILFLVVFNLLFFGVGMAQGINETESIGDSFYSKGQVREALYAYQRAAFYSPGGAGAGLLMKIAECFDIEGDFEKSIEYLDHAYYTNPPDSLKKEILFNKASSFIKTGNYHFALIELLGIDAAPESLTARRKSLYLASTYYGLGDYEKAEEYFISIVKQNSEAEKKIHDIFSKRGNFYRPDPSAAMWLSVFIPGSGQLYSGDWSAGLNSLLLTGSLVGLTFYMTKLYHPIDAILTALPWFQRYYQGGFDQSRIIAEKKRERKRKEFFQKIMDLIELAEKTDT